MWEAVNERETERKRVRVTDREKWRRTMRGGKERESPGRL